MASDTRILRCLNCNFHIQTHPTHPRVRCPECDVIGYPDRAGRNLVPIAWECLKCGTRNDGMRNFCLECGAGLATKCLKCEAPVYTAICLHCGSHQDALVRLRAAQSERENWVPLQRAYIDAEQATPQQPTRQSIPIMPPLQETDPDTAASWQTLWPSVDRSMRQAAANRSQRIAQQRRRRRSWRFGQNRRMALAWLAAGIAFLIWQLREVIPTRIADLAQTQAAQPVILALTEWWATVTQIFSRGPVDTSSPEYAAFFALTLFGVAAAPVLFYLLVRTIRKII